MKQFAPTLENLALRFSKLSVRERVLVLGAAIAMILVVWKLTLMGPLDAKRNSLQQELFVLQDNMSETADATEAAQASDPVSLAFTKQQALQGELKQVNGELAKESSGLIEHKRMAEG